VNFNQARVFFTYTGNLTELYVYFIYLLCATLMVTMTTALATVNSRCHVYVYLYTMFAIYSRSASLYII